MSCLQALHAFRCERPPSSVPAAAPHHADRADPTKYGRGTSPGSDRARAQRTVVARLCHSSASRKGLAMTSGSSARRPGDNLPASRPLGCCMHFVGTLSCPVPVTGTCVCMVRYHVNDRVLQIRRKRLPDARASPRHLECLPDARASPRRRGCLSDARASARHLECLPDAQPPSVSDTPSLGVWETTGCIRYTQSVYTLQMISVFRHPHVCRHWCLLELDTQCCP